MVFSQDFDTVAEAEQDLRRNYDNVDHPISFAGIATIFRWYRRKLPQKNIENVLSTFESYTLHKEMKEGRRNPHFLYLKNHRKEIDLCDVAKFKKDNDGVTFIVILIDCWTRFMVAEPVKNKSATDVLEAVKRMFNRIKEFPKYLGGDRGVEFINKKMQTYCSKNNIIYTPNYNYVHASFVERANRTFKKILFSWMTENETLNYLPHLQELVQLYNKRYNRTMMMSPNDAELKENHLQLRRNMSRHYVNFFRRKRKPTFQVGDIVRIAKSKGHFSRSFHEQSQVEFFKINKVNTRLPIPTYTISDYDGDEVIIGNFYGFELSHVRNEVWRIDHVIKKRKIRKKTQYFVRWKGFGSKHDQWIDEKDISKNFR